MRPKLSVKEQIAHMGKRGIAFKLITEEDAADYLENNNYYFKIKAYAKMFEIYQTGDKKGQYVNLDFAYLKEMAILDMHLRHFIIKAAVDLEHTLKVQFMKDFNSSDSDGYEIVQKYFEIFPDAKNKILSKRSSSYCRDLIEKLEHEKYALWNVIEILSFGDFIQLYDLFYEEFPAAKSDRIYTYPMRSVKSLRNAAAHNNCILNQLTRALDGDLHKNRKVESFVSKIPTIGKAQRKNCMQMQAVHDFVTLLYMLDNVIQSDGMKSKIVAELRWLIDERMPRHKEYFEKNARIRSVYDFVKKIVDIL